MKIGVVGLGLIGGSVAKAFTERSDHEVYGFDANPATNGYAVLSGMVRGELTDEVLPQCDLLILCPYPFAAADYLRQAAPKIKKAVDKNTQTWYLYHAD